MVRRGKIDLPRNGENIGFELGRHVRIQVVVGQAVEQGEVRVVHIQALLQDGQDAVLLQLAVQAFEDLPLPVGLVGELGQLIRLGGFEKLPELRLVDGELGVKVGRLPAQISFAFSRLRARWLILCRTVDRSGCAHASGEMAFDAGFQGGFVGLARHVSGVPFSNSLHDGIH